MIIGIYLTVLVLSVLAWRLLHIIQVEDPKNPGNYQKIKFPRYLYICYWLMMPFYPINLVVAGGAILLVALLPTMVEEDYKINSKLLKWLCKEI